MKPWGHAMNRTPAAAGSTILRFSTEMFTPRERVTAWREFYGRGILKVDIEAHSASDFRADATMRILPDLGILSGTTAACRHDRSKHLVDNDNVILAIGSIGESRFAMCGRETLMGVGDAVLTGGGESGFKETREPSRFICLQMRKSLLASHVASLDDALGRRIPAGTPALQLLRHYLGVFDEAEVLAAPSLQRQMAAHIHDLVALTVGPTRDAMESASGRGAGAARLRAIKADITGHLAQGDLSIGSIATRHRLPVRYVQRLFEADGTSFSEFLLRERLALARRLLSNPRSANLKISAIALDAGFGNLSYFNASFRRRYGASPSDLRAQGRREH